MWTSFVNCFVTFENTNVTFLAQLRQFEFAKIAKGRFFCERAFKSN